MKNVQEQVFKEGIGWVLGNNTAAVFSFAMSIIKILVKKKKSGKCKYNFKRVDYTVHSFSRALTDTKVESLGTLERK